MTAATGFTRLGFVVAGLIAAGLGAVVGVSSMIPADKVRDAVIAEIRAVTGLDPVLRGDTTVSLFPSGTVTFTDVALGDERSATPALSAERLTAKLRVFPLLIGRIEVADVSLVKPAISVTFDAAGRSNWSGLIDRLARAVDPTTVRAASFSEIRITDGTVALRNDVSDIDETLSDVEMSLAWPSISRSFAATGRFAWRDQPVDASVSIADFVAALTGDRSGLKLRLTSVPLKVAFDGSLSHRPTLKVEGTLSADSTSLRDALNWAHRKTLPEGGFGRFALKAQTNVVGGSVALTGVNVELDGNTAEGVLAFATDGRQTWQGTLATETLDLTPYVSTIRLLTEDSRGWNRVPLSLDWLSAFDLDLRLSAARVALAQTRLGRTAIAANLRGGRFTVTLGESQAFDGVLRGSFGLAKSEAGADLRAQLQFSDVNLESCVAALFGIRRLEGRGNLALAFEASGSSVMALTRSLNGTASLTGRQGALAGLNIEQLLRRLERRPLSGGSEFRSGRTPFEQLIVTVRMTQGTAQIEQVSIEGGALRVDVVGSASIPGRDLDLKGMASLLTAAAGAPPSFELPFVVQGPWDDPIVLPDTQALIQRSRAASPLLDAMRDRRAREAVRNAIERLTGSGGAGAAAPAAASQPVQPAAEPSLAQ